MNAVEVTCPNCGARYRLKTVVGPGKRMRCAECDHRWVPVVEMPGEYEPFGAASDTVSAPGTIGPDSDAASASQWREQPEPVTDGAPAEPLADDLVGAEDEEPPRPRIVRTIVAIVLGLGLTVAAAGLWVGDRAPELLGGVPVVGDLIARPSPPPLTLTAHGMTTLLPSGKQVLDVTGTLTNATRSALPVPPLAASLAGPRGTALRWTIDPPTPELAAGQSVTFMSTVTGFPADARTLSVALTR